jgi:hypothetical protein
VSVDLTVVDNRHAIGLDIVRFCESLATYEFPKLCQSFPFDIGIKTEQLIAIVVIFFFAGGQLGSQLGKGIQNACRGYLKLSIFGIVSNEFKSFRQELDRQDCMSVSLQSFGRDSWSQPTQASLGLFAIGRSGLCTNPYPIRDESSSQSLATGVAALRLAPRDRNGDTIPPCRS